MKTITIDNISIPIEEYRKMDQIAEKKANEKMKAYRWPTIEIKMAWYRVYMREQIREYAEQQLVKIKDEFQKFDELLEEEFKKNDGVIDLTNFRKKFEEEG